MLKGIKCNYTIITKDSILTGNKDSGSKDNTKSIIEQDSNIWNVFKERRSAYCHHHFIMGEFNIQFINLEPHRSRISPYRPNHIIESSSIQSMDPS